MVKMADMTIMSTEKVERNGEKCLNLLDRFDQIFRMK